MVCRQSLPTLKALKSHYIAAHSKIQLVRALLKNTIYEKHIKSKSDCRFDNVRPQYLKSEILYLEDGFVNSDDAEDAGKISVPLPKFEIKQESDDSDSQNILEKSDNKNVLEKVRRRKERLLKLRNFRFDKSLRGNKRFVSLNDQTGLFYICRCSENEKSNVILDYFRKNDVQNLISDTESCSDAENSFYIPNTNYKYYCNICGNGYTRKTKLIEHFEVHNTNCHICKKRFSTNFLYKQHMKRHLLKLFVCHLCEAEFGVKNMLMDHLDGHIEDDVFKNVFSLEQDYKIENCFYGGNDVYFG